MIEIYITDLTPEKAKQLVEATPHIPPRKYATCPIMRIQATIETEATSPTEATNLCPNCGNILTAEPDESVEYDGSVSVNYLPFCDYCQEFVPINQTIEQEIGKYKNR